MGSAGPGTQRRISEWVAGGGGAAEPRELAKRSRVASKPEAVRPEGGGSRFATCPFCSAHVHQALAAAHVELHMLEMEAAAAGAACAESAGDILEARPPWAKRFILIQ